MRLLSQFKLINFVCSLKELCCPVYWLKELLFVSSSFLNLRYATKMARREPKRVQIRDDFEEREPLLPLNGGVGSSGGPTSAGALSTSSSIGGVVVTKKPTSVPKRTTKTSQKLTLFPEGLNENANDSKSNVDDPLLPHVSAKTQKERWLSKLERKWLPRVTAYCTAKYDCLVFTLNFVSNTLSLQFVQYG